MTGGFGGDLALPLSRIIPLKGMVKVPDISYCIVQSFNKGVLLESFQILNQIRDFKNYCSNNQNGH